MRDALLDVLTDPVRLGFWLAVAAVLGAVLSEVAWVFRLRRWRRRDALLDAARRVQCTTTLTSSSSSFELEHLRDGELVTISGGSRPEHNGLRVVRRPDAHSPGVLCELYQPTRWDLWREFLRIALRRPWRLRLSWNRGWRRRPAIITGVFRWPPPEDHAP